jgi:hypothetical protein
MPCAFETSTISSTVSTCSLCLLICSANLSLKVSSYPSSVWSCT